MLDAVRRRAERGVSAGLPPPMGALARGMVLGADEDIPAAMSDDFKDSGLAHVLAVSGQNVALLAALAWPLLAAAGLGRRGRLVGVAVLIALYVPVTGAGPSILRAGVMGLAAVVAAFAGRPASRWYALLLAAALTLACDPRAWQDVGLAAQLRGRGRHLRARAPARRRDARAARAAPHGRCADRGGDARHRSADGLPLRARVAGGAARRTWPRCRRSRW